MKKAAQAVPNHKLKRERELRSWSQLDVADRVGSTARNVSRWERGITQPGPYLRQELCKLFGKGPGELGFLPTAEDTQIAGKEHDSQDLPQAAYDLDTGESLPSGDASEPLIWHVPYQRNPFFTGRDEILENLRTMLVGDEGDENEASCPQALSGLGGIGKTQLALEYAYRYRKDYPIVLWVQADTQETFITDLVQAANLLQLPEQHNPDQQRVVVAVKRWLNNHSRWLLILDNADNLGLVRDFMPTAGGGHILLTTRTQMTGTVAHRIIVEQLPIEEGIRFLLRRAKIQAMHESLDPAMYEDWKAAKAIVETMDGLPLALDQAAAYIEETECGLSGYLERYQRRHATLLKRRGNAPSDHPQPVATTWSLAFEKVQNANPAASELLKLCAFLHPDAIYEEMLSAAAPVCSADLQPLAADPLEFDAAIETLRMFSLIRRDPNSHTLTLHRLVQEVLREQMDEEMRRNWAINTVRGLAVAFPEVEFHAWSRCQQCLPHALLCAKFIEQWQITLPEAIQLLNKTGHYLRERSYLAEAEQILTQALAICEQAPSVAPVATALALNNLGKLYYERSKYTQAEPHFQRALTLYEEALGPEHPGVATVLHNLAELHHRQGNYARGEALAQHALAIRERSLDPEHPDVADSLNLLAMLSQIQGRFEQAEELYRRALTIHQRTLGQEHPKVAENLNNLAFLYRSQGKYALAEPLYRQALAFCEKNLGLQHMYTAISLENLADVYYNQGKYAQAEQHVLQALKICEQAANISHSLWAKVLTLQAEIYTVQGRYAQAEPLVWRALEIWEETLGQKHPGAANSLTVLAQLHCAQKRYAQAEELAQRALAIRQHAWGTQHRATARSLNTLAEIYAAQARHTEAEPLFKQALAVLENSLGPEHPDVALCLIGLALTYHALNRPEDARPLFSHLWRVYNAMPAPLYPRLAHALEVYRNLLRRAGNENMAKEVEKSFQDIAGKSIA